MANPDFSKQTVETLARRARFQCSNPDCRILTVGPNSDAHKATVIGEAAHIYGAKPGSKRYVPSMSDVARAEITNGIWLCRNCHGVIDRDETGHPAELLYAWRQSHEELVLSELGTIGERLRHEAQMAHIDFLRQYPPMIQRIAVDKPEAWEWRFVAELMRYLNKSQFKRLKNLQTGYYFKTFPSVDANGFIEWLHERTHIMSNLVPPLEGLIDRLTASWGEPGEPGDLEEMHDVCILIRDMLARMVDHEEVLRFTNIPEEGEDLRALLVDAVGDNVSKLAEIPEKLDEMIAFNNTNHGGTADNPTVVNWVITFELPKNFEKRFDRALRRLNSTFRFG